MRKKDREEKNKRETEVVNEEASRTKKNGACAGSSVYKSSGSVDSRRTDSNLPIKPSFVFLINECV